MIINKFLIILMLTSIVPIVSGTIQVYSTDLGKVQIDMPYILVPNPDWGVPSGNSLQLGLAITPNDAFPNIKWLNIVGINLQNLTIFDAKSAEDIATLMLGNASDPDYKYEVQEMLTNDHHKMLFYTEKGQPPYHYYVFIDYQKEKNCVVEIDSLSEKYYFKPMTTFDKAEFQDICKSFTFINETKTRSLTTDVSDDNSKDAAEKIAIMNVLTNANIRVLYLGVGDGRLKGGNKVLVISYSSTATDTKGVLDETSKILGAYLGAIKSGWDCEVLSVIVGDNTGKITLATWICTKEWTDAYVRGDLTSEEIMMKALGSTSLLI